MESEYNYYCAMTGYTGRFEDWLKWELTNRIKLFY